MRPLFLTLLIALYSAAPMSVMSMMAGAAPDSPANRVDPVSANSPWSGVVAIKIGDGAYSGVLLANRYVLTAAHVASGAVTTPANLRVIFNIPAGTFSIPASQIDVFPTYSYPYDDLALIRLSTDAPGEATRYAVQDTVIATGTTIKLVGYGASGFGNVGASVGGNESVRRVGENVVDVFAASVDTSGKTSAFFVYDFDGATGNGAMGGGTLGNARETMVASGDSGSPSFVTSSGNSAGQAVVMGINTFATPLSANTAVTYTFGQGGGGMRLSDPRFITWLRTTSSYEVRMASDPASQWGDAPLPVLASIGLAGGLLLVLRRRRTVQTREHRRDAN